MRGTYRRLHGTEQFLGFYDVHADCLNGLFRKRKRLLDICEAFQRLRLCYRRKRLFVILDNPHNLHDYPRFLAPLKKLRIHPVWTPTEASWLNLIEAQFGVLKRATLVNTDDPDHRTPDAESTVTSAIAIANSATSVTRSTASDQLVLLSWNSTRRDLHVGSRTSASILVRYRSRRPR